ncbi:MAG: hypothetical protein WAZ34_03855 [Rhodocyclaceae bacterium]
MNSVVHIFLTASPEQAARLGALQSAFAEVCNALAPIVQQTRCWNRVGLHHLAYRGLRERFPQIGSQMVCNAIYSVSRTCRLVLQHPASPMNVAKFPDRPLPLLRFLPSAPVYFDRHTLSIRGVQLSMYTLDGRMKFQLDLKPEDVSRFEQQKLREIVLANTAKGYCLSFSFAADEAAEETEDSIATPCVAEFPEYVVVTPGTESVAGADFLPQQPSAMGRQLHTVSI